MRAWIALLSAAALLVLAGCGTDPTGTSAAGGGDGEKQEQTGTPASLDFTGTTLEGEKFEGASLVGQPAVFWFWAPWCPTCRAQAPSLSKLAKKHEGEVAVVGVGGLDSDAAIQAMAEDIPHVIHLVDLEGTVWKHFGVTEQSTFEVIDADGEIVSSGYLDIGDLQDLVADLAQ